MKHTIFIPLTPSRGQYYSKSGVYYWKPTFSIYPMRQLGIGTGYYIALLLLLSCFSRVRLCGTQWTAAHQAPPSLGFSRQEHWSGLPFPSPMRESEVAQSRPTLSDPIGLQPSRLLCPWDFPGKSTGPPLNRMSKF